MDEALSSMIRKIIKEELSSLTTEVSELKKEVKMLQTDFQKQLQIIQNQLITNSVNNQNKIKKVNEYKRDIPNSIDQSEMGMSEKKIEMKANEDLPDSPLWNQVLINIENAFQSHHLKRGLTDQMLNN